MNFYLSAVPHVLADLPEGVDGVRATLACMTKFARQYKKDVVVGTLARELVRNLPANDRRGEIIHLHGFVRDAIRYVRDPDGVEMVQSPKRTLQIGQGDCDDKATLLSALLGSIGFPTRFVAIGISDPRSIALLTRSKFLSSIPNLAPYSHVLLEAKLGTRWIPLETIIPGVAAGWSPPDVARLMTAHV